MNKYARITVHCYSLQSFLDYCHENKIIFENGVLDGEYDFSFSVNKANYKKIVKSDFQIKKKEKFKKYQNIEETLLNKITVISLLLSILFYGFLNSLVLKIEINGISKEINSQLEISLKEKGINAFSRKKDISNLKEIEKELFLEFQDKIDLLSITSKGAFIFVNYEKKKDEIYIEGKHGKMFSKSDAIIKKIIISSGNVLVKENQFVKKGQLIVDDTLYYKEEGIVVGTKGKIYGNTFKRVTLNCKNTKLSQEELLQEFLFESRRKVLLEDSIIEKEIVQDYFYSKTNSYIVIHYTLYEDIVAF